MWWSNDASDQLSCDRAHLGEVPMNLFGQSMLGLSATSDFGDV